jgi:hypothetical protein
VAIESSESSDQFDLLKKLDRINSDMVQISLSASFFKLKLNLNYRLILEQNGLDLIGSG